MKKMYRLFALLLAFALALGCVQIAAADTPADLDNVDLVYWVGCNPDQKDAGIVMPVLDEIAKDALNVNLDLVIVATSEFKEKFNKAMAAQERIDLTWTGYIQSIQELVNMGALMPMDGLIEEYGQDLLASLDQRLIDAHRSADGKLYQFPAWQGMVGRRSYYAFPKNKIDATVGEQWVEELQEIMYANWDKNTVEAHMAVYDKMEEWLAQLKEKDMLGYGYRPSVTNSLYFWYDRKTYVPLSFSYIDLWDDTFTVKPMVGSDWDRALAKLMAEWFDKGYIRADIASIDSKAENKEGYVDVNSDECYTMFGHNGYTEDLSKELAGWVKPVYTLHTNPYCWTELGTATGTSIPFTAAEPERAMMFMNWLVTDDEKAIEWYNTYTYGLEGKHYEWNEEHTDIIVYGGTGQATMDFDWGQRPWYMGTLLNAYSSPSFPASYYDELQALQENAYTSPMLGFSFDYSDVEVEYNLLSAIDKEYDDMVHLGYLGVAGIDAKYDEYVDKMYAAGLQNLIDALQEQVTAFVTEKNRTW